MESISNNYLCLLIDLETHVIFTIKNNYTNTCLLLMADNNYLIPRQNILLPLIFILDMNPTI